METTTLSPDNTRWEGDTQELRERRDSPNRLDQLYDIMESQPLSLLLPIGTVTRDDLYNRTSTIDLCFGTPGVEAQLIKCQAHQREGRGMNKGSDHFPVETVLDLRWKTELAPRKRKWDDTDKKLFTQSLIEYLPEPPSPLHTLAHSESHITPEVKEAIDRKTSIRAEVPRETSCWLLFTDFDSKINSLGCLSCDGSRTRSKIFGWSEELSPKGSLENQSNYVLKYFWVCNI